MDKKKITLIIGLIVVAVLILGLAIGFYLFPKSALYTSKDFSFRYPKDWNLRESHGRQEKYFQVHVFGAIDNETGFGPSVTLTVYPKDGVGSSEELANSVLAMVQKIPSYKLISDAISTWVRGVKARQIKTLFSLRLPLYKISARDIAIQSELLFFEKGKNTFVLSYKNLQSGYASSEKAFKTIVQTLRLK